MIVLISLLAFSLFFQQSSVDLPEIVFPEQPGYGIELNYPVFRPGTLWDYINGAADAYLSYRFEDLHIAEYVDGEFRAKVEVYRHASPSHAFGMYAQERSPDYHFEEIGVQGYSEPTLVNFTGGVYYIKISGNRAEGDLLMRIARAMERLLGHDSRMPGLLGAFPAGNQLPYTDSFVSSSFLGHSFLGEVYSADYQTEGRKFTFFALECEDCAEVLRRYYHFARIQDPVIAPGLHRITDRYNGDISLLWTGSMLIGAVDCPSDELFREMSLELKDALL